MTSLRDFGIDRGHYVSTAVFHLQDFVDAFHSLGWITVDANEQLEPTERIVEMQRALGLSLTQLAPYSDDSVVVNPLFGPPSVPPVLVEVFVLMPFTEDLKPVYEDHIKAVATNLGTTSARADDFFSANSVITEVWNAILHARVLIADCTRRNPNVFYELGIAHTLGKPVILIAQDKEDIPFDIQHMRTILYDFTPRGMRDFEATLEETLRYELKGPQALSDLLVVE